MAEKFNAGQRILLDDNALHAGDTSLNEPQARENMAFAPILPVEDLAKSQSRKRQEPWEDSGKDRRHGHPSLCLSSHTNLVTTFIPRVLSTEKPMS